MTNTIFVGFERVRDVQIPEKAYEDDAGFDLFIPKDVGDISQYKLADYGFLIPSGLKLQLPTGYCAILQNRSSIARAGYRVGACVLDAGFRAEFMIHLIGSTHSPKLQPGQKVVQMVILPVPYVQLGECKITIDTERGSRSFGSSDKETSSG